MANQPTNLSFEECEHLLAKVQWRPGWTLTLHHTVQSFDNGHETPMLRISGYVDDTYTGKRQYIGHAHTLPPVAIYRTPKDFLSEVLRALQKVDQHECAEWFRVNGAHVADPHDLEGRYVGVILSDKLNRALSDPRVALVNQVPPLDISDIYATPLLNHLGGASGQDKDTSQS